MMLDKDEENKNLTPVEISKDFLSETIKQKAKETTDVKEAIALAATQQAVAKEETVKKLIDEKTHELTFDAERNKIQSETEKINKEVEKVRAEKERELAELEKSIASKKAERDELEAQDKKAEAYFEAHKSILKCIGIREKLSICAMKGWLRIASVVYFIFQIILLPLTIIGFTVEQIMNIVDAISNKVTKAGWKIAISVVSVIIIVALLFGAYYGGSWAIANLFKR